MSDLTLPRDARVFVAGSGGLVGSAVVRRLRAEGFSDVVGARSAELDLRDAGATRVWFERVRPAVVVDAAARVGGIAANAAEPVEFLTGNRRIQTNLFTAAHAAGVDRLLFLNPSCIYRSSRRGGPGPKPGEPGRRASRPAPRATAGTSAGWSTCSSGMCADDDRREGVPAGEQVRW